MCVAIIDILIIFFIIILVLWLIGLLGWLSVGIVEFIPQPILWILLVIGIVLIIVWVIVRFCYPTHWSNRRSVFVLGNVSPERQGSVNEAEV